MLRGKSKFVIGFCRLQNHLFDICTRRAPLLYIVVLDVSTLEQAWKIMHQCI